MAFLFGALMEGSQENQKILLNSLPGASNHDKLDSLAEQARDFVSFYTELAARLSEAHSVENGSVETRIDAETQGQTHLSELALDAKGQDAARGIIRFLGELRDTV